LSVASTGFEFNVPPLPESGFAGWGLVIKSDIDEAQLTLQRRFHTSQGGGGLSSPNINLYIDGKFTRLGIAAPAFNATFKPQSSAVTNFIAYPLTAEQLKVWPRYGYVREEVSVDQSTSETAQAPSSCVSWEAKFDPADIWTIEVQSQDAGNWTTDTKLLSVSTGTAPWLWSGGEVPAQTPLRLSLSHDKAGTIATQLYWKVAI